MTKSHHCGGPGKGMKGNCHKSKGICRTYQVKCRTVLDNGRICNTKHLKIESCPSCGRWDPSFDQNCVLGLRTLVKVGSQSEQESVFVSGLESLLSPSTRTQVVQVEISLDIRIIQWGLLRSFLTLIKLFSNDIFSSWSSPRLRPSSYILAVHSCLRYHKRRCLVRLPRKDGARSITVFARMWSFLQPRLNGPRRRRYDINKNSL